MKKNVPALLGLILGIAPVAGTAQVQPLVASNAAFAFNLYGQLAPTPGNLFFSPYSISTCLAMLYAGARGDTELQMSQVLGFGTDQQQFASLFGQLQAQLETDQQPNALQLNIANALWTQEGYPFLPAFLATATNQYQANVNQADFVTDAAAVTQAINDWVAQETQNKIQNILGPGSVTPDTRLVLANAIYFLGAWTESFAETNTLVQPFYLGSNQVVEVPLMHQPAPTASGIPFNYMSTYPTWTGPAPGANDFQAIELPYASNQVSMLILLPAQPDGLPWLEQQLAPAFLSNVLARMEPLPIEVFLPKFTLESYFNLAPTLAQMGMPDAFAPGSADFSGIDGMTDLFISFVVHKAWAQVGETGTEAAAATVVGIVGLAPPPPIVFRADHPFLFLIRDTQTGSLLFLGRVTNPSSAAPPPTAALTLARSAGRLTVCWPASLTGLTLQRSPDLANWTSMSGASNDGTNYSVAITPSRSQNLFLRLGPP